MLHILCTGLSKVINGGSEMGAETAQVAKVA